MQRNAEVEAAVQGLMEAMRQGDAAAFTGQLSSELTAGIGTDDAEWWDGHAAAAAAVTAQLEASGGLPFQPGDVRGYAVDGMGWFEDHGMVTTDDGQSHPVRMTGVLRQEDGDWRLLQMHVSLGTPNEEMGMGDLPV